MKTSESELIQEGTNQNLKFFFKCPHYRGEGLSTCFQHKIQKPAAVIVCTCIINAEPYKRISVGDMFSHILYV